MMNSLLLTFYLILSCAVISIQTADPPPASDTNSTEVIRNEKPDGDNSTAILYSEVAEIDNGTDIASVDNSKDFNLEHYVTKLTNDLLPEDYNKNIRPHFGKRPMIVNMSININDINSISETSMDFNVDFYLRHIWQDHRLNFPIRYNISVISLGEEFSKKIWLPATFFHNAKTLDIHKTANSGQTTALRIAANGTVEYTRKLSMLAKCSMDLTYFPVDNQMCSILLSIYGKTRDEVLYRWRNDSAAVEFNRDISLPTFRLIGFSKANEIIKGSSETAGRLKLDLFISRYISYYVAQVYIPACLVVIISWVPFWLDRDSHARVALGVTTVLTMTTLITNTSSSLPKVSHLTALDVYLFFCFIQVFLSLIEYATVGYFDSKCAKEAAEAEAARAAENGNSEMTELNASNSKPSKKELLIHDTSSIDYAARRVFPITFFIFNVAYSVALYCIDVSDSITNEIQFKF